MGGVMIMIALLAADVLPSTGFSPNVLPETRLWFWSSNNNMRREPSRLPQACRQAMLRGKTQGACAPRMAISQASGSNQIQWPTLDEVTPPVHVKIAASAQSAPDVSSLGSLVPPVGKKTIADYAVQVNDKFRKPLRSGYFPLRVAYGDRIEGADLEGARFALTGDLRIGCPSYMHLLPPVAGESVQRLWITSFGMARAGGVVGLDLTGKLPALRLKTELAWPNAVEHVPEDFLAPLFGEGFNVTASLLIADGFLVPGKTDGGVFLVRNPGSREELSARLTRTDDSRWFYHRAIPFEMQGHKGVLTARALKPLSPFQAARGELLWLEAPNATNPTAPWNVPWREVVLAEGPDVMFEVVDLDRTDDTVEVFAAEFFAQRLTMHSLKWDSSKNQPAVVQREVLDDSLGQAYSVAIGDLEGPNSHLLVTTHEYLPVPTKGGLTLGSSSSWSYMKDSLAPQQAQEVNGGSLFAYRIPTVWRRRSDGYVPSIDTFKAMLPEMFARIDADGSGEISVNELEASLSWLRVQVTPETLRSAFEDADWDGSGTIEYEEFERILLDLRRMPESKPKKGLDSLGDRIGEGLKTLGAGVSKAGSGAGVSMAGFLDSVQASLPVEAQEQPTGCGLDELDEILNKAYGSEPFWKDARVRQIFEQLDTDKDGLLSKQEVRELCMLIWKDNTSSRNVWAVLAGALESVLSKGSASDDDKEQAVKWTRTTLATGFSVKRAGINPGAPGFVYPFYPHKSMRRGSAPPHLLVAGDCSDAAYIFRPVRSETKDGSGVDVVDMEGPSIYGPWGETQRQGALQGRAEFKFLYPGQPAQVRMDFRYPVTTGDTGRLRYELMATFGCEGTVGSVAIGNVDTVHSIDDGWAKFFLPVYEKDRVFMLKCGDPPTIGYLDDDDW